MQLLKLIVVPVLALSLTGCIAAAVGAGAAGGMYFERHYKIEKKNKSASKQTIDSSKTTTTSKTNSEPSRA